MGNKLTYEFVKNFIEIESKSGCKLISEEYVSINKNLEIKCKCGNSFFTTFHTFKNSKQQCEECNNRINWTYEKVKEYISQKGYFLISENYISNIQKLVICDSDGYFYCTTIATIQNNVPERFHTANPYTIQNIKLWCKLNNKPFVLVSDTYEGNSRNLLWKCLKEGCGEIFKAKWGNIMTGKGCGICGGLQVGLSNCLATKNPELSKEWHPTLNGDLTPYDVTCGTRRAVFWQCKNNSKHIWSANIDNRSKNRGCPYCAGKLPSEDYNLLICNPELCEEWNYEKNDKMPEEYLPNSSKKVWWKCIICGHEWKSAIYSRNNGNGCHKCKKSIGENKIRDLIISKGIHFIQQYTFSECKYKNVLQFDFYLQDFNTCIEFQGLQHYEPVDFAGKGEEWAKELFKTNLIRDQMKRDYCNKNNIKLIEIPYWDFDNIEEILDKELKLNAYNISN